MSSNYIVRQIPLDCRCLSVTAPDCVRYLCFPTTLSNARGWLYLIDKFNHKYIVSSDIDEYGWLTLDTSLLPPGLLSPYSGEFLIYFTIEGAAEWDREHFTNGKYAYNCLKLSIRKTTFARNIHINPTDCYSVQLDKYQCCCENFTELCPANYSIDCSNPPLVDFSIDYVQSDTPDNVPIPPPPPPPNTFLPCCLPCEELLAAINCISYNYSLLYTTATYFARTPGWRELAPLSNPITLYYFLGLEEACLLYWFDFNRDTGEVRIVRDGLPIDCIKGSETDIIGAGISLEDGREYVVTTIFRGEGECRDELFGISFLFRARSAAIDFKLEVLGAKVCSNPYAIITPEDFHTICNTCQP